MKTFGISLLVAGAAVAPAWSCDLCAVYSASEARGETGKGWFSGVAEQFTRYGSLQTDGVGVPNPGGQYMNSSISQVFVGYNFKNRVGVQVNVPFIYRSYRRVDDTTGAVDTGTESGLGDVSLLGHWSPVQKQLKNGIIRWSLLGGLKLPTGNTRRLAEPDMGAVHGHDLALGSGSVDGVVGTGVFASWNRWFFTANSQYAIRTEGDYGRRYANDLTWSGGPGYFLVTKDKFTLSLQANVTGEYKGTDRDQGAPDPETAMKTVFLGPQLEASFHDKYSLSLGGEVPVSINASGTQAVPDYRVRAAFTVRF